MSLIDPAFAEKVACGRAVVLRCWPELYGELLLEAVNSECDSQRDSQ